MAEMKIENIDADRKLYTSRNHSFGSDAVMLSFTASKFRGKSMCDLGTGCGVIPMLTDKWGKFDSILGIDIQPEAIELFSSSINNSKLAAKVTSLLADLKELPKGYKNIFDVVTCNPPYEKITKGKISDNPQRAIARTELKCNIDDVIKSAFHLLRPQGRLVLCQRPHRLADVLVAMAKGGINAKEIRFYSKDDKTPPWMFIVVGQKGAKSEMRVQENFYIYNNGEYTDEYKEIYKEVF